MRGLNFSIVLVILAIIFEQVASKFVVSSLNTLALDENNRLTDHWLLYSNNDQCARRIQGAWSRRADYTGRMVAPFDGEAFSQFFSDSSADDTCYAVCLERGSLQGHLPYLFPHYQYKGERDLSSWIDDCQRVELGFISYAPHDATIYWRSFDGEMINVGDLRRGERNTIWQNTFIGHTFEVIDKVTRASLGVFTAEHTGFFVIGENKSGINRALNFTEEIKDTFVHEWKRANDVKRTFTELGFKRSRLPADIFTSMSAYYYNNRGQKFVEEWNSKGVFVNWWEVDAFMIPIPWELKRYWQRRLMTLVEAWSQTKLEMTDIYGMRQYEKGARLISHVDRQSTHGVSLIVNIAQGQGQASNSKKMNSNKIVEPWKVEIYDFGMRLHEIEMNEGDIVYYESAHALHGRMKPLKDAFYVNLFTHYRPIDDPDWYHRPNPAGWTPEPVIDIGDCELHADPAQPNAMSLPSHMRKGKVHCSHFDSNVRVKELMETLSPSMEVLHGADDIFRWWQQTGEDHSLPPVPVHHIPTHSEL